MSFEFLFLLYFIYLFFYLCEFSVHCVPKGQKKPSEPGAGTGVTHSCEPPYGCWDLNLDPSGRAAGVVNC